jgi:apolipoprotein D and lipocalin family protein
MKTFFKAVTMMSLSFLIVDASGESSAIKYEPVSNFVLSRYLGKWYEIARMPAWFEKNLTNVTANYTLKKNGMVKVENAGSKNGKIKIAIGKAKYAGNQNVGYLRVSFFGPFYADYKIISLDTNYQYAMVTSSEKYLWILCRNPKIEEKILKELVTRADSLGFKADKLYLTPQN